MFRLWVRPLINFTKTSPRIKVSSRGTVQDAVFTTDSFKLYKLDEGPPASTTVTREQALEYYTTMTTLRRLETAAASLYKMRAVRGFCHLYSGQEAIAVGMEASLTKDDAIITSYRAHAWTYMREVSVLGVLAELTGRSTGCSKGKGGSMHMYGKNFYGGNGIVGAQVPLGAGIAFAMKYKGLKNVCVTLYGDGAANQGQVFEAFNIAKLWDLPVIFVCENNIYAMGTAAPRSSANTDYYTRGDYIPGIFVDAMDVIAVRSATKFAKNFVLDNGPILMECATYRYYGHSMSDPGTSYRSREEVQEVRQNRDPITSFRDKVIQAKLVGDDELREIDAKVKREIEAAGDKAKNDPELPVSEMYTHILCEPTPLDMRVRGCDPFTFGHMGGGK